VPFGVGRFSCFFVAGGLFLVPFLAVFAAGARFLIAFLITFLITFLTGLVLFFFVAIPIS
jgi:hypothetical protein